MSLPGVVTTVFDHFHGLNYNPFVNLNQSAKVIGDGLVLRPYLKCGRTAKFQPEKYAMEIGSKKMYAGRIIWEFSHSKTARNSIIGRLGWKWGVCVN